MPRKKKTPSPKIRSQEQVQFFAQMALIQVVDDIDLYRQAIAALVPIVERAAARLEADVAELEQSLVSETTP